MQSPRHFRNSIKPIVHNASSAHLCLLPLSMHSFCNRTSSCRRVYLYLYFKCHHHSAQTPVNILVDYFQFVVRNALWPIYLCLFLVGSCEGGGEESRKLESGIRVWMPRYWLITETLPICTHKGPLDPRLYYYRGGPLNLQI